MMDAGDMKGGEPQDWYRDFADDERPYVLAIDKASDRWLAWGSGLLLGLLVGGLVGYTIRAGWWM